MIKQRTLGRTGISVSELGMGCGMLGSVWHRKTDREGKAAVAAALDAGITFFDTADCYGLGRSERLLGRSVNRAHKRGDVVIATKAGLVKTPLALLRGMRSSPGGVRQAAQIVRTRAVYSPKYIERSLEASLRRLGTDYVDVFFLHSPLWTVLEGDDLVAALADLKRQGKVRATGLSLRVAEDALLPIKRPRVDCIEVEFNLCSAQREATSAVVSQAAAAGMAVVARQPFASGALLNERLGALDKAAVRRTCLQAALSDPGISVVIPGMSSGEHVRQNVVAVRSESSPGAVVTEIRSHACGSSN